MALTLTLVMATRKKTAEDPHKAVNLALGKRLAHFRALRGLSQRELAERVSVVQVVVSDYEVGKLRLTAEVALRFAAALDVPIQELLQIDTPPEIAQQRKPAARCWRGWRRFRASPAASRTPSSPPSTTSSTAPPARPSNACSSNMRRRHSSHDQQPPAAEASVKAARFLRVHRSEAESLDGRRSGGYFGHRCRWPVFSTSSRTVTATFTRRNREHADSPPTASFHSRSPTATCKRQRFHGY